MTQYAFYFDQSRCYSCHACSVACKDWNGIEAGPEKWMSVYEWEEGQFPDLRVRSLAFACAHCDDPACMAACGTGAIFREGEFGAVLVDRERCTGCRLCYDACPYGAPKFADDSVGTKMSKCTMCVDKLARGEAPICVASCPLRALDYGSVDELESRYGTSRQLEGMPSPTTRPNFIVSPASDRIELVRYDKAKAVRLMQKRAGFEDVFERLSDVTEVPAEGLESSSLRMKHKTGDSLLGATRNFAG